MGHEGDAQYSQEQGSHAPEHYDAIANGAIFGTDLRLGETISTKIPPKFDGLQAWWSYAENVKDWE